MTRTNFSHKNGPNDQMCFFSRILWPCSWLLECEIHRAPVFGLLDRTNGLLVFLFLRKRSECIQSISKGYQISTVLANSVLSRCFFNIITFHIYFKRPWNTEFCLPLMPLAAPASFWRRHEDLLQHRYPPRLERKRMDTQRTAAHKGPRYFQEKMTCKKTVTGMANHGTILKGTRWNEMHRKEWKACLLKHS